MIFWRREGWRRRDISSNYFDDLCIFHIQRLLNLRGTGAGVPRALWLIGHCASDMSASRLLRVCNFLTCSSWLLVTFSFVMLRNIVTCFLSLCRISFSHVTFVRIACRDRLRRHSGDAYWRSYGRLCSPTVNRLESTRSSQVSTVSVSGDLTWVGRYQFILLGDKRTYVWTTYLRLLLYRQCGRRESNSRSSSRKSNALTTRLPRHPWMEGTQTSHESIRRGGGVSTGGVEATAQNLGCPQVSPRFTHWVYNVTYCGSTRVVALYKSFKLTTVKVLHTYTSSCPHIFVGPKIVPHFLSARNATEDRSGGVGDKSQTMFNFRRVSELVLDRKRKFLQKILFVRQYYMRNSCIYGEGWVVKPTFS